MIRAASSRDAEELAVPRHAVWPSSTIDEHRRELLTLLQPDGDDVASFVVTAGERLVGFAEVALRRETR